MSAFSSVAMNCVWTKLADTDGTNGIQLSNAAVEFGIRLAIGGVGQLPGILALIDNNSASALSSGKGL